MLHATGRPRSWAAGLLSSLLLAVVAAGCSTSHSIPPPRATADDSSSDAVSAAQVLDRLSSALRSGNAPAAASLGIDDGKGLLAAVAGNAKRLHIAALDMRYVDDDPGDLSAAQRQLLGPTAWVAAVDVDYRIPHYDPSMTRMEVSFTFVRTSSGIRVAGIGGHGDRSPLWMRTALQVSGTPYTLVMAGSGEDLRRYATLARRAIVDVRKVLPDWRGKLVLEIPPTEALLDSVLDTDQAEYANIAAVTTTVDGTIVRGSPVHVFINPEIFGPIGPRGSQVVISHESTHVAMNAAFSTMPKWLLEGFADYVALDHANIPVTTAASQILPRIRKHGLPEHLPTANDLSPTAGGLGATYEEAWLTCRYLAKTYGESKLIAFYRAVDSSGSTGQAFETVLGTSQRQFVRGWHADLERLAHGGVAR